jgi:hypothetical protein
MRFDGPLSAGAPDKQLIQIDKMQIPQRLRSRFSMLRMVNWKVPRIFKGFFESQESAQSAKRFAESDVRKA